MRFLAGLLVVVGIFIAAGGRFAVPGVITMLLGCYLYDKGAQRSGGELVASVLLLLGGLGAAAMVVQYLIERFTASP